MDMKKMMKQAQRMQAELAKAQDEIKDMEFEATAGGGMVKVVATGDMARQEHRHRPGSGRPRKTWRCWKTWCSRR